MCGVDSRPGIFQLIMEETFKGIPGVAIVVDDLVVTGETDEQHLENLERALSKLAAFGFRVRANKCEFFKEQITYFGYKIYKNEISIDPEKYQAIVEMSTRSNNNEMQLLLGKINYYGRLFKNRTEKLAPLYEVSNREEFRWDQKCQKAFELTKIELKRIVVN